MNIQGLQKLTLLDFPGHVACTVFLGGCDFRCPFCHNGELLDGSAPVLMTEKELLAFLKTRKGLLDGVAITGGEPTLRPDLPQLLESIRDLGFAVKLDTNGNHPEALRRLLERKLVDYVAMDIKNSPERYGETVGIPGFSMENISKSLMLLKASGVTYELRTTVVAEFHNEDSFRAIGPWIEGAEHYFLQCFTDRDSVPEKGLHAPTKEIMEHYAEIVSPFVGEVSLRGI